MLLFPSGRPSTIHPSMIASYLSWVSSTATFLSSTATFVDSYCHLLPFHFSPPLPSRFSPLPRPLFSMRWRISCDARRPASSTSVLFFSSRWEISLFTLSDGARKEDKYFHSPFVQWNQIFPVWSVKKNNVCFLNFFTFYSEKLAKKHALNGNMGIPTVLFKQNGIDERLCECMLCIIWWLRMLTIMHEIGETSIARIGQWIKLYAIKSVLHDRQSLSMPKSFTTFIGLLYHEKSRLDMPHKALQMLSPPSTHSQLLTMC